jgi:hypothetical protein
MRKWDQTIEFAHMTMRRAVLTGVVVVTTVVLVPSAQS